MQVVKMALKKLNNGSVRKLFLVAGNEDGMTDCVCFSKWSLIYDL